MAEDWRKKGYDEFMLRQLKARGGQFTDPEGLGSLELEHPDDTIPPSALQAGSMLGQFEVADGYLQSVGYGGGTATGSGWRLNSDGTVEGIGASPAGNDTEVQFNDGGSFGADADFTYEKTEELEGSNGLLSVNEVTAPSTKSFFYLTGRDGTLASDNAQYVQIKAGDAASGGTNRHGGWVTLYGGDTESPTNVNQGGGTVGLYAGDTVAGNGDGGYVTLRAGDGLGTGGGGWLDFYAGDGGDSTSGRIGGCIGLWAGDGGTNADGGIIYLDSGTKGSSGTTQGYLNIDGGGKDDPSILMDSSQIQLGGSNLTDGYAATIDFAPYYNELDSDPHTVTRHNYINLRNLLSGSVPSVSPARSYIQPTDACVFRFDAAAGTHKAVDSGSTHPDIDTTDAWVKVNINGTVYYIPAYTDKS